MREILIITGKRVVLAVIEATRIRKTWLLLLLILLSSLSAADAYANQAPVADAGPSRYAGMDAIVLDGTGSYDPDPGDTLSYEWIQVSGEPVILSQTNTATPTLQRSPDINEQYFVELSLTVTDSQQATSTDTVQVMIIWNNGPDYLSSDILENEIWLGEPFDPNKPTFVFVGRGSCWGKDEGYYTYGFAWYPYVNVIALDCYYGDDCKGFTDRLIVYLSKVAPYYNQPIEMAGFSANGHVALGFARGMNKSYLDPRYNVTRVTLLDAPWINEVDTNDFFASAIDGEPAWIVNYRSSLGEYHPGVVNVLVFGEHYTPVEWYRQSITSAHSVNTYKHGVVAGAFVSVAGLGKNYNVPRGAADYYYFNWPNKGAFQYFNQSLYPGAFPEPVTLIGPADKAVVQPQGVTLGSGTSENAVAYQLLFGEDQYHLNVVLNDDRPFEINTGPLQPNKEFFWTVKVRDQYGTTIHADPRSFQTPAGLVGDLNNDAVLDQSDCALLKSALNTSWGHPQFALSADLDGDQVITCNDAQIWLEQYRAYLQNPSAPDPCGLEDTIDTDGDGVRDLCDNCPFVANADNVDQDGDGVGDACDNCWQEKNCPQFDYDGDGMGDICDDDNDNDGLLDADDNCPFYATQDQTDFDGDGVGDACDNCLNQSNFRQENSDDDLLGDICDNCPTVDNDDQADGDMDTIGDVCDNCPAVANTNQVDTDNDMMGDACDDDDDDDGVPDIADNCPTIPNFDQADFDQDGLGDTCDTDRDGDDRSDIWDNCPMIYNPDQADGDADTVGDVCDNCPNVANTEQADFDADTVGDICDDDRDGDGLLNALDNCPTIPNIDQADDDNDGVGDVCDQCPGTSPIYGVGPDGCALPIPGDFDGDDDVDLEDFGAFQICVSGYGSPQTDPDCSPAHMDADSDVDTADLTLFKGCISGANVIADAHCAD